MQECLNKNNLVFYKTKKTIIQRMSTEEQTKESPVVAETKETKEPEERGNSIQEEEESGSSSSSESSSYSSNSDRAGSSNEADRSDRSESMSKRDALRQCRRMGNTMPMVQYRRYQQRKTQEMLKKLTEREEKE